jgi:phosphoribosylformylglycinamidine synthase
MQAARDNADCAAAEYKAILDDADPGLSPVVPFELSKQAYAGKPKVAILREEGVNGQAEMAAAFVRAGFTAVDVHLNDLIQGTRKLDEFAGLAACGGFSYGDVLGAGEGWAKTILCNPQLREQFQQFFERPDTFSLGVCNGCQMLAALKELIPGAAHWPVFMRNESEQFEARVVTLQIEKSPSVLLADMEGAHLPVPTAHGEGRAVFAGKAEQTKAAVAARYINNSGKPTQAYPLSPNGSPDGIAALVSDDGRATIIMPHPERVFLTSQLSWHPADWAEESPWFKLFQNARAWVEQQKPADKTTKP